MNSRYIYEQFFTVIIPVPNVIRSLIHAFLSPSLHLQSYAPMPKVLLMGRGVAANSTGARASSISHTCFTGAGTATSHSLPASSSALSKRCCDLVHDLGLDPPEYLLLRQIIKMRRPSTTRKRRVRPTGTPMRSALSSEGVLFSPSVMDVVASSLDGVLLSKPCQCHGYPQEGAREAVWGELRRCSWARHFT